MPTEVSVVKGFTKSITTPYSVTSDKRIVAFTVLVLSGTCNIIGSDRIDNEDSTAVSLPTGAVVTVAASNTGVLDGWTITPVGGTTNLIAQR